MILPEPSSGHSGKSNTNNQISLQTPITQPTKVSNTQECGAKKLCRQMSNCEEAKFYLNNCGITRLDGDGDGVPCEKLCK